MNYRIAVPSALVGLAIASFGLGQRKPTVNNQAASDAKMSDHGKIEKLLGEVSDLQKKLAALTQNYDAHT